MPGIVWGLWDFMVDKAAMLPAMKWAYGLAEKRPITLKSEY